MMKPLALTLSAVLALSVLSGCGGAAAPAATQAPAPAAAPTQTVAAPEPTPAPTETPAASKAPSNVATAADMTTVEEVVEEGMTPVYAASLVDGVYPVTMKSSSSMFKADHCELVVAGGKLSAVLYMASDAYPFMYAGTAAEAAEAPESAYLPLSGDGDLKTFTLPLNALDDGESFAAYSQRKELWYDRTLLFRADSLPAEAFAEGFFTTAASLALTDGAYTVNVKLSGGSGKATVGSPAVMHVSGGAASAEVVWSSPNYDYMRIGEEKFLPVNTEGNSAFIIPVAYFDRPITVYADTTAMSTPHEIEYTLTFDAASVAAAK